MIDLSRLAEPMQGDGCRAELVREEFRELLRAACAEDGDIWSILPPSSKLSSGRNFSLAAYLVRTRPATSR